ncbi:MAG TPA: hypothetical protein VKY19_26100 [Ktedonosporobacter sp.]|jgi:hypothetical protein|nr:hypothetical protein [Ktedonosporobacter sp.]
MRKMFLSRAAALLTLLLTTLAFMLSGAPASYAAAHQAAAVPASVTVIENPSTEDTNGNFIATVSGRGLHKNANYVLTDNNFSCTDSINTAGSLMVTTDLVGRFSITFLGGPSFFTTTPCQAGKYIVTATLQVLPSVFVTTTFKVQPPTSFGTIASLYFNPNPVVLSTNGGFVDALYGKGWTPGKAFSITPVTSSCAVLFPTTNPFSFVDGVGNFALGFGGTGCSAGTVKLLVIVGTSSHIVTLHLAAPSV